MEFQGCYSSYLVRLWLTEQVGGEIEPPTWQGELINIQSGNKIRFDNLEKLIQHLEKQVEVMGSDRNSDLNPDGFPQ
jgi:hypothetical protein